MGKIYSVFGLGKAGKAALDFLRSQGVEIYAWDDGHERVEAIKEEFTFQRNAGKDKDLHFRTIHEDTHVHFTPVQAQPWEKIDQLVLSPGVPLNFPEQHEVVKQARANDVEIICDIDLLFLNNPDAKYIGITGTNGKSTTTALIHHIFEEAGIEAVLGGNYGTPATALPKLNQDGVYVLELSSYQLDLIKYARFDAVILLNITPDHIDRHGSMEGYITAKKSILGMIRDDGKAIIAIDDEYTKMLYKEFASGGGEVEEVSKEDIELPKNPSLQGEHNAQNIAVSKAVAQFFDVNKNKIDNALESFPGLAHRMQYIGKYKNIEFVNDSKATNAIAAEQALNTYDNIYWIVGGVAKEGGIEPLKHLFPKIKKAYLIGEAAENFSETIEENNVEFEISGKLSVAVSLALKNAEGTSEQAVILLSPACASFDQFPNFEARGEAFIKLVEKYV